MEARKEMAAWALRDTYRTLNTQSLTGQREKITQRRRDTQRNAELGGEKREEARRLETGLREGV